MKRLAICCVPLLVATACMDQPTALEDPSGLGLVVVSGDAQVGEAFQELPAPVVVRLLEVDKDKVVPGQTVNFRVIQGGGSVFAGAATTDKDGLAADYWTLGAPGPQVLEVRAVTAGGQKLVLGTFTATAIAPPPTTGAVNFNWIVNGTAPASGCPAGGIVTFTSTAAPAGATSVSASGACSAGLLLIPGLAAGYWTFDASLTDGVTTVTVPISLDVVAGSTADVPVAFTFTPTGDVNFNWTVNGAAPASGCPAGGIVTFTSTAAPAGATSVSASGACSAGLLLVPDLAAGYWTFDASLTDGVTTVTVPVNVDVVAGSTADVPVAFTF